MLYISNNEVQREGIRAYSSSEEKVSSLKVMVRNMTGMLTLKMVCGLKYQDMARKK